MNTKINMKFSPSRPILTVLLGSLTVAGTLLVSILNHGTGEASLLGGDKVPTVGARLSLSAEDSKEGKWSYCDAETPAEPTYGAELVQVNVDEDITPGGIFAVDMVFKNTGNTRLFAANTGCSGAILNVGTQGEQDRASLFGDPSHAISGWISPNRVKMTDPYVDPEGTFHVIFQSLAPEGDNIYHEMFQPVVEGQAWVGEPVSAEISVGSPSEEMKANMAFVKTTSLAASDLTGLERNIQVSLADQTMSVRFGETSVWDLKVSTGASDTPTPRGTYKILSKQELRIGGKSPHYRMPYFQMWDSRGFGIHALPYLGTDGGTFWTEALNHIGRPVSHGCVRTLPEDAAALYEFTEIGTPIVVQ